ncbi:MAG: tRNA uridine-5-carboxymethylaminomethyl(34) synthesis enzyme MnmG [Oscillospiraceae bacterium]|nr:tRNA uridine-5-carboxymethylaminomethyl(34) synthesis enzyme MnmG [Candidatus Equicaccousia limihippi]
MEFFVDNLDVAVIGAGHAGIEAALASARLGAKTAVFTINLDWVGNMPCNPSIGGTAKGHLVREIDALGGEMGLAADRNTLQIRMLNRGKGAAVHSLRAQIDRRNYSGDMKHTLETTENLTVKQGEIVSLKKQKDGTYNISTALGATYNAKCVIMATGTFLKGKIFVGDVNYEGGPDGTFAATKLSKDLKALGFPLRRFKTGTPARVLKSSMDFSKMEVQEGDENIIPFSYRTRKKPKNSVVCYMTYTNEQTKKVILDNIHLSPLYSGVIEGVGPRYCPSIEDKIVRFADKERHQLFVEPCGKNTEEMYLQGMSSSLPESVQTQFYKTIPGLEKVQIMRTAYAIEYDCVDPLYLNATLETKEHKGLFGAGQFNGSSGYEEAAAQGLVAGINAARRAKGQELIVLPRSSGYIGTLIDDLVTKGCTDPYRMMTSRSEYRLVLRQDNADERLTPLGYEIGLINEKEYRAFKIRKGKKEREIARLKTVFLPPSKKVNEFLISRGTAPLNTGCSLYELIKRPELDYFVLAPFDKGRKKLPFEICESVETEIKYEGYIKRQEAQIAESLRLESKELPENTDYQSISGLRLEAREKLCKVMPKNIGQASRISGVTPADIEVLLIYLQTKKG